nr:hypothetical protein [Tanacetum cinerariifolium]
DNVIDQRLVLLYLHLAWTSPPLEYPLGQEDSKPYFFSDSRAYLDWLIKMPLGF